LWRKKVTAADFGDKFLLHLGKASINHQAKRIALARLANGNVDVQQKMFSQSACIILYKVQR
jgi:hypothetical protein